MSLRPPAHVVRFRTIDGACCWRRSLLANPSQLATATWTPNNVKLSAARSFSQSLAPRSVTAAPPNRLKAGYFLSNGFLPRVQDAGRAATTRRSSASATTTDETDKQGTTLSHINQDLPHRRKQAAKRRTAATAAPTESSTAPAAAALSPEAAASDNPLPAEDASSALTTAAARQSAHSLRRQLSLYLSLSKPRLTVLVVLTAMSSYALYPVPDFLSATVGLADAPSLSPLTLAFLTTGTALCSASANALNMLYEPATDALMTRTRNRPLVRGLLSARRAGAFAALAAATGVAALYFGVNPTVAFLGAANIVLYAGVYTPLKRLHWLNTWAGAVVGGIPPLMGWAAAAGESATGTGSFAELLLTPDAAGGWLLAALLFAWQFPHFMALSWGIRDEYRRAGHQMLAWVHPARNGRVALRYSLAFFPICAGLCAVGATDWSFAVTSAPINAWLAREAVRFWRLQGLQGSAKGLFWASVWHLPVVMVLALAQKKGMWARVWRLVVGEDGEWEEVWEEGEYDSDDDEAGRGGEQ